MNKTLLFLLLPLLSNAQSGINNLWMMGYGNEVGFPNGGINIDFSSGAPVISYQIRQINFTDQSSAICDSLGNILFSTNGVIISDATGDTMQNGSGLSPCNFSQYAFDGLSIPQSALIIADPGNGSTYYIFHSSLDDNISYAYSIYYSKVDMNANGGLGSVIIKNVAFLNDTLIPGRITSVKHANGRDWWIVFHQGNSDLIYVYLLEPSGLSLNSSQHIGSVRSRYRGQVCFSPDGRKYAYYDPLNDLDIMDFDRCNGIFSNCISVAMNDSAGGGGCAFSPNSKVLYVSSTLYVYQFDLTAANIPASQTTIAIWDSTYSPSFPCATTFYLSQLAPDGKIYISSTNSVVSMHVINNPDSLGASCNICQHCISLPAYNGFTIPNHPNYFLAAEGGTVCDSLSTSISNISVNRSLNFSCFPNPAIDQITFFYSATDEPGAITIFNIEGKIIIEYLLTSKSSFTQVPLPAMSNGIYLARLTSNKWQSDLLFVIE